MTKRLFVAVPVSEDVKERIELVYSRLRETGADFNFIDLNNVHFTLKFLGDVEEDKIAEVKEKIAEILGSQKKFEIKLVGVGVFPNLDKIKVVWAGVEDGKLLELMKKVNSELNYIRKDEHEKEVAHLTVARVRSGRDIERLQKVLKEIEGMDFGTMLVDKVILYESELTSKGPVYTIVEEFTLL